MRIAAGRLSVVSVGLALAALTSVGPAAARNARDRGAIRVRTDGRLRPGHLEAIRVSGFPGKGVTQVSFFPTAICEIECSAPNVPGGRTDANGFAKFAVRVPGTFIDEHHHRAYFRDGERIDVEVTWEGANGDLAAGSAEPEPILVRVHDHRNG